MKTKGSELKSALQSSMSIEADHKKLIAKLMKEKKTMVKAETSLKASVVRESDENKSNAD